MIPIGGKKDKNASRPRKSGVALRRRLMDHRRRLIDLGFDEKDIKKFTRKDMLVLLNNPKKAVASLNK